MSVMTERCVEAAFKADWRFGAKFHPEDQRKIVAAIIEAMREPTEDMKAPEDVHWGYGCHVCGGLTEGWHAMIDIALGKVDA